MMNAKEYLGQARMLDQRITVKLERVARLRSMTQKITVTLEGEQVSHSRNASSLQDLIIQLMEEEESLNVSIDRLVDLKHEITSVLEQVTDPVCQLLLEMRYLCFNSWEKIAECMHMNIRTVYKVHGRALHLVDVVLKSEKLQETTQIGQ